jgi:hypothetical protein
VQSRERALVACRCGIEQRSELPALLRRAIAADRRHAGLACTSKKGFDDQHRLLLHLPRVPVRGRRRRFISGCTMLAAMTPL